MPRRLLSLCRNLFRKQAVEHELGEELQSTLEILTEENIRDGLPPPHARRQALVELGGLEQVKEEVRSTRTGHLLDELRQDLRYALRSLARSPGFTVIAVIVLALGIGANSAVVSIIDAIVFRPLPVWQPDRLATITSPASYPDYLDLKKGDQAFSGLAAFGGTPLELSGDGHPDGFSGRCVSANFFQVLGLKMAAGRGFLPEEDAVPGSPVVVISYRYWERDFQADPAAIGKILKLNGEPVTIVGVAPRGFRDMSYIGAYQDVWIPISIFYRVQHLDQDPIWHDVLVARDKRWLGLVGRLKPGMTLAQARAGVRVFADQLKAAYPQTNADWNPGLNSLLNPRMPKGATIFSLSILLAAAICILLITCTNVGSLLLGRVSGRRREIATRLALGASRARVARQLLTEGMVLSVTAFTAGLAVWGAALRFLPAIEGTYPGLGTVGSPQDMELSIDHRILIIALGITLLTILIFALAPSLIGSRMDLTSALKNQGFLSAGRAGSRCRRIMVVIQVAISVILLVGAGLFIRTILRFESVEPGFDLNTIVLNISRPFRGFDPPRSVNFYRHALASVRSVPGILSATLAATLPPEQFSLSHDTHVIQSSADADKGRWIRCNYIGSYFFKTLQMPILQGREFTEFDDSKAPGVVIVNESMALRYWPDSSPLGKRIQVDRFDVQEKEIKSFEVVGVVADAKYASVWQGAAPYLYFPYLQSYFNSRDPVFLIDTHGDPKSCLEQIRRALEPFGSDVRVDHARLMSEEMGSMISHERSTAYFLGVFGGIALLLTAIGLYGLISYYVIQRTREFGIRMALGARPLDIIRQVMREGMSLLMTGLAIGLPCSIVLSRFIGSRLHGLRPTDPLTYASISLMTLSIAIGAILLAARRATSNTLEALRFE